MIAMTAGAAGMIVFLSLSALYHETPGRVSHIVRFLHRATNPDQGRISAQYRNNQGFTDIPRLPKIKEDALNIAVFKASAGGSHPRL